MTSAWYCSVEDAGRPLDEYIGPGLQLMEQDLEMAGNNIKLIVPRSSDAVMDYYIDASQSLGHKNKLPKNIAIRPGTIIH